MLFLAVLMNIPNSKVCLKGEWSIDCMTLRGKALKSGKSLNVEKFNITITRYEKLVYKPEYREIKRDRVRVSASPFVFPA